MTTDQINPIDANHLSHKIEETWDAYNKNGSLTYDQSDVVEQAISGLDKGWLRVCTPTDKGDWQVHEWLKKAICLYLYSRQSDIMGGGIHKWFDKVPLKMHHWNEGDFKEAAFRAVPSCTIRHGAYVAPGAVIMPSYINIGAYVGEGTMIDTWATVGSCAQIGARCHISGGAGIGGVLEPLQAQPVIVEDDCFIGARSEVAEGVRIGKGAVLSMGVYIGQSTKIFNRKTGELHYGYVPPYSVVVPGSLPDKNSEAHLYAAIIVKTVDEKTRSKTSLNDLLRD
jgi:2,3,4,5-tetrahydropyridine-2-carboxylate N-succinyltransferase